MASLIFIGFVLSTLQAGFLLIHLNDCCLSLNRVTQYASPFGISFLEAFSLPHGPRMARRIRQERMRA